MKPISEILPPATLALWQRLEREPALSGFYLLGGTALALKIGHRSSEDLDFAWPELNLPRQRIDAFQRVLERDGWELCRDDSDDSYDEFQIAGLDLHDFQQNFIATSLIGNVKLNLFAPAGPLQNLLLPTGQPYPKLADAVLLFQSKALVSAERSTSRDRLDLYLLMSEHGFTFDDFADAFRKAHAPRLLLDSALVKLREDKLPSTDPGYAALAPDAASIEEITAFFREHIDQWYRQEADRALGDSDQQE